MDAVKGLFKIHAVWWCCLEWGSGPCILVLFEYLLGLLCLSHWSPNSEMRLIMMSLARISLGTDRRFTPRPVAQGFFFRRLYDDTLPPSRQVVFASPILLERVVEELVHQTVTLSWRVLRWGCPLRIWWLPWFLFLVMRCCFQRSYYTDLLRATVWTTKRYFQPKFA